MRMITSNNSCQGTPAAEEKLLMLFNLLMFKLLLLMMMMMMLSLLRLDEGVPKDKGRVQVNSATSNYSRSPINKE